MDTERWVRVYDGTLASVPGTAIIAEVLWEIREGKIKPNTKTPSAEKQ